MNKLRVVKALVFILTFLIVFGLCIIAGSVYKKTKGISKSIPEAISLEEPAGSSIKEIKEVNGALYILVKDGGTPDRIIIFDTIKNKKISKITLD